MASPSRHELASLILCALLAAACVASLTAAAQQPQPTPARTPAPPFKLTAEDMKDGEAELNDAPWPYHFDDDMSWAARDYDDSGWRVGGFRQAVTHPENSPPGERWAGRAWFRIPLDVDDKLAGQPLALRLVHWGASEVYIDGALVKRFGVVAPESDVESSPHFVPIPFAFAAGGRHVIAIRYSYMAARDPSTGLGHWLTNGNFRPNVDGGIYTADAALTSGIRGAASNYGGRLFVGVLAALGLLHFLLYAFYRRERQSYLNPSDPALEDRISPDDRPNRYTVAASYRLPLGRGRLVGKEMNRVLDAVVGGWQLNGTYEWQSGQPLNFTQNIYYSGDPTQLQSHTFEPDGHGHKYGVFECTNTAVCTNLPIFPTTGFTRLSSFGLRNFKTTYDNLRSMPYQAVNLSLSKNFDISEGKRLQLRAEALNAFNHAYVIDFNLDPSNSRFGFSGGTQRNLPRDIQLGAKFVF